MDPDIQLLNEKIDTLTALTADTNQVIRSMRRTQRWGQVFQIVWWLLIFGVSGAAYYYYLQPYMTQLIHLYQNFQSGSHQAQGFEQQIADYIRQHFSAPTQIK